MDAETWLPLETLVIQGDPLYVNVWERGCPQRRSFPWNILWTSVVTHGNTWLPWKCVVTCGNAWLPTCMVAHANAWLHTGKYVFTPGYPWKRMVAMEMRDGYPWKHVVTTETHGYLWRRRRW